jgi:hypothetical protein
MQAVVTISEVVFCLSLAICAVVLLVRLVGWWRLREVRRAVSDARTLEETRAYVAWVRNMPPPPARPSKPPAVVPTPVKPPETGKWRPFPGRRVAGG